MKNGGRIPWNVTAIYETFKISCPMGRPYERQFGTPFNVPVILFWSNGRISPYFCEGPIETSSTRSQSLAGFFLGYALHAGGICNGDMLVADIEELEETNASEVHGKRLAAKEVLTPMRGEYENFQLQMERSNFLEEIRN